MKEVWKPIENYEGLYEVSNTGKIKTFYGRNGAKFLKPLINKTHGYSTVCLYKNKKLKNVRLHKLVASAFILNPEEYYDINHKDGNKTNNHVDNLEWCNRSHNMKHCFALGKHSKKKLTNYAVSRIRDRRGENPKLLASIYGVTPTYIRELWRGAKRREQFDKLYEELNK